LDPEDLGNAHDNSDLDKSDLEAADDLIDDVLDKVDKSETDTDEKIDDLGETDDKKEQLDKAVDVAKNL